MNILITGISGRIGANVAKAYADAGHHVRGLVWSNDLRTDKLAGLQAELIEGSLVDMDDVRRAVEGADAICHLGAAFQGGGPFTNEDYFEINVRGTFNMLEAAVQFAPNLQHFFFASSDALYSKYLPAGIPEPIREDEMPLEPGGSYALTKLLGEDLCRGYLRNSGLPVTIFRFALTVSTDEILTFRQFYLSHWIAAYSNKRSEAATALSQRMLDVQAAAGGKEVLVIARDESGRSYKKHIADVRDIVAGFTAALGQRSVVGETFQLASPTPFTWEETIPYLAANSTCRPQI
ncbi:MAG: NAD(P)-dependent oxidoreductase [Caldilineaceae bacterium]|nr:NAD(P)-dependent oxidoreductase [Caldilineaceae bacterium]